MFSAPPAPGGDNRILPWAQAEAEPASSRRSAHPLQPEGGGDPAGSDGDISPNSAAAEVVDRRRWTVERRHTSHVPWEARLATLKSYQEEHGDCNVPRDWVGDPKLALWVSNQRQYKKRLDRGEPCEGMTAARAANRDKPGI